MLKHGWSVWLATAVGIGVVAYIAGVELRIFPLYYAPISLVAWHWDQAGALVAAGACA